MFGKEKKSKALSAVPIPKIETTIGPNAYFRGDIQADGGVRYSEAHDCTSKGSSTHRACGA